MDISAPREEKLSPERRLALLTAGAGALGSAVRLEEVLPRLLDMARLAVAADAYAIWRRDGVTGAWRALAHAGLSERYVREATDLAAPTPVPREPMVLDDPDSAPQLAAHRAVQRAEGIESLLVAPLLLQDEPSGTLVFYYRAPHRPTPAEVDAATLVATLAANAVMSAELVEARVVSEARYRFLAEHASDIVLRIAPDGRLLDVSPAVGRILGHDPDALIGTAARDLVHPDDLAQLRPFDPPQGERSARLVRHRHADGRWVPLEVLMSVLRDERGAATELVASLRDVSERLRAEQGERESARRLAILMKVQEDLARDLELDRVVQSATDAATSLTGAAFGAFFYNVTDERGDRYTLYSLSGAPREAFAKFPMPRATKVFDPTFRGEGIVRSDDIMQDPRYGQSAPYHGMPPGHLPVRSYLAVPVISVTGTVHGGFFLGHPEPGRFSKETEELAASIAGQAAIALDNAFLYRRSRENERRLAESEARFRTLVTAATQMVWSTDETGQIVDMPEWRAFTGQTEEEVRGIGWLDAVHPEDRPRVVATWEEAFAKRALYEAEYRVRGRDGTYRHFTARAIPRFDAEGELLEYIGTWTDITPQRQALLEADALRTRLIQGEKLAALGQLVSGVAHELRTPLTFLANNAYLLQHRLEAAAKRGADAHAALEAATPFLLEITGGVDRINQLVEDLRRYTKARQGRELVEAPLHTMIADAVELFRAANRAVNPVSTSFAPTRRVRANRGALQQVALNLLQNAAEASAAGSPIHLATRQDGEHAVLEVSDRGCGIPPEVLARMYEPLYTTKAEGTGLGLSIVRRIADEHDARIECDSRVGVGTTFRIRFPTA